MLHSLQKGKQNFTNHWHLQVCFWCLFFSSYRLGLRCGSFEFFGGRDNILKKKIFCRHACTKKKFMHWWSLQEKKIHTFSDWKIACYNKKKLHINLRHQKEKLSLYMKGVKQIMPVPNHPTPHQTSNGPPLSRWLSVLLFDSNIIQVEKTKKF